MSVNRLLIREIVSRLEPNGLLDVLVGLGAWLDVNVNPETLLQHNRNLTEKNNEKTTWKIKSK